MKAWILIVSGGLALAASPPLVIRNARVVTVSGPVLAKGTVVIRDGLIAAVGESLAAPAGAWIVEGEGLTVYPGLIDALSSLGMPEPVRPAATGTATTTAAPPARGPEDRPATQPWLRAADLLKPADAHLESARNAGFTTAVIFPRVGIFAGQGAVVNLAGERAGGMILTAAAGQYVTTATSGGFGNYPGSLLGTMAYIRQLFLDADYYAKANQYYAAHVQGSRRPAYDRALEALLESPRALFPARRMVEAERMIRMGRELKLKVVLYGGWEAYRGAAAMRQAAVPMLVSLRWPERTRDAEPGEEDPLRILELRDKAPSSPAALQKAGAQWAFATEGLERRAEVWRAVRRAIEAGLAPDAAVRALTLSPAEIYGLSDRIGSIEKGKIANLLVTKGDLFQEQTEVKFIVIDGEKYEPVPDPPAGGRPGAAAAPATTTPTEPNQ